MLGHLASFHWAEASVDELSARILFSFRVISKPVEIEGPYLGFILHALPKIADNVVLPAMTTLPNFPNSRWFCL